MPMSQGNFSSGPVGLLLVAWAKINPATGAIISGAGFSGVVRNSIGVYTLTFTNARAAVNYVVDAKTGFDSNQGGDNLVTYGAQNTVSFQLTNSQYQSGTGSISSDPRFLHVAVYE